jgi:hypothetical protein
MAKPTAIEVISRENTVFSLIAVTKMSSITTPNTIIIKGIAVDLI